jgi:hypothetical protein
MITIDKVVKRFIELRDEIERITAKATEEVNQLKAQQVKLSAWVLKKSEEEKWENQKTANGTVYITTADTAIVEDWDQFLEEVKENNAWELLTHGANKTEVRDYVLRNNMVPKGVRYVTRKEPRFNRPRTAKAVYDNGKDE